jgi:ribulose-5-phosphate 4-epimerase/fuculose-1-phosphate aldolase
MISCFCCQPSSLGRRALLASAVAFAAIPARAETTPASGGPVDPALIEDLVAGNRILYDQNVVDGFGHISVRHPKDPNRYLLSKSMAPALVTADDIVEYDLDSNPVNANGRTSYLERFIHGEIYKVRPDVMSVVHSHSAGVIPFADTGVPLRPMNHISSFLGEGVPVFEIRTVGGPATDMLIRNAALGKALAAKLGKHSIMLMRGHGSVAAAKSIKDVVFRSIYTEVNARMQAEAMKLGKPEFLNTEEAAAATKTNEALVGRPWELWKRRAMAKP